MNDVVELGLSRPGPPEVTPQPLENHSALKGLTEAFLKLFYDFAPEADDTDVTAFKTVLDDARGQIALSGHEQEIRRVALSSIRACEQFLKRSRHYYATREAELTEIISILRETAKRLAGDSTEFSVQMRATTDRFRGLAQLDDIRQLKKNLTQEANALQRTVEEKTQRDQKALSELTKRVGTLQAHLVEAEEQALLDPLTKIANRGSFDRSLVGMAKAARAARTPLALAMIDVDQFKAINDAHGHPIGDRVLLCTAQWLTSAVRHTDMVARMGGDEFAVILFEADLAIAEGRFLKVLDEIASRSFDYDLEGEARSIRFTVSCGVAQLTGSESEQDLVRRADQALYEAKRSGPGRVVTKKRSKLGAFFG